jgi:hypothetical protein
MKKQFPKDFAVLRTALMLSTIAFYCFPAPAQTPIPSPSPAPTPITKTGSIVVNSPSTVGRITKWVGSSNNGTGTIGDSVITESSVGTIGIGTNPFSDYKLGVGGGISATGTINTSTQYNIGGSRMLSIAGTNNVMVGAGAGQNNTANDSAFFGFAAGQANTTGVRNSFFGSNAARVNTTGGDNGFFGAFAGASNTTGSNNGFFGAFAGRNNTTGQHNNFFGSNAGISNTIGSNNSFFGLAAGRNNSNGSNNAFFGYVAGEQTTGGDNAFFGASAGEANTTGIRNSFFGSSAGLSNTTENNNTFIGAFSNGAASITNATAVGADAVVTQSNSVVLGNNANVGIGTSAPQAKLHVQGNGIVGQFDGNVTINGSLNLIGTVDASRVTGTLTNATIQGSQVTGTVNNATNASVASTVSVPLNLSGTNNVITITGNGGVPNLIVNSTETGGGAAIEATNAANNGQAIVARNTAGGYAVFAESFGGQPTISGTNHAEGGGAGVFGRTLDSTSNGVGVYGYADFGKAIFGEAFNGGNAVEGLSRSATGVGINGRNDSGGLAGRFEGGDVYVQSVGKGIILKATDGPNCFRVTVDNSGQITTALVTCPP